MQIKKKGRAIGGIVIRTSTLIRISLLAPTFFVSWFLAKQYLVLRKLHENPHQETETPFESLRGIKTQYIVKPGDGRDDRSVCLSPEKDVPWILDGSCEKHKYLTNFSSIGPIRSCGFCGDNAAYLRELRDEISAKYKEKCKDLVVYGAALGRKYEGMLSSGEGGHISKVVKRHGTCFFQFVTDSRGTGNTLTGDGSQNLIVVDPARMPYKNNRRNTKVIKFNPGLLFPWADRVIWQDVKVQRRVYMWEKKMILPSDYMLHFKRTVERFGTCSSFVSLPLHPLTVQTAKEVDIKPHCDTIISAAWSRPTVSDSLYVLRSQCKRYETRLNVTAQAGRSEVFDKAPLVDTAFIVYDMRNQECKQFNGNLGCSLLDEIHCYSDRDQVSFPLVVANSGLRLSPALRTPGHELRDRVYINENNVPLLHLAKRSCHWYYNSFGRCVAPEGEEVGDSIDNENGAEVKKKKPKVAVIVAGTFQRFIFKSTVDRLLNRIIKDMDVDYYVSLTTAKAKSYRSGSDYADHLQIDPSVPQQKFDDNINIEEYFRQSMPQHVRIGALQIQESIDIDSEPMLKARREKALAANPNEDPDQMFPVIDNRSTDIARRTANANRNLLRMHLAIQNLWRSALKWEAEEGFKYDYVFFLRDDTFWLERFNIWKIIKKEGDIFVPACDARNPRMDSHELCDHILISRRNAADLFGNYYSTLFQTDIRGCMDHLPKKLSLDGKRGCNSEMLLKWVTEKKSISVTKVGQGEVPMQRSANVRLPDGTNVKCFHKFCQSKSAPLWFTNGYKRCQSINWNLLFEDPGDLSFRSVLRWFYLKTII